MPITSRPAITSGIVCVWIGVGVRYFSSARARVIKSSSLKSSKAVKLVNSIAFIVAGCAAALPAAEAPGPLLRAKATSRAIWAVNGFKKKRAGSRLAVSVRAARASLMRLLNSSYAAGLFVSRQFPSSASTGRSQHAIGSASLWGGGLLGKPQRFQSLGPFANRPAAGQIFLHCLCTFFGALLFFETRLRPRASLGRSGFTGSGRQWQLLPERTAQTVDHARYCRERGLFRASASRRAYICIEEAKCKRCNSRPIRDLPP